MTKRSAIALRLLIEAGPSSRFCREYHDVLNFFKTGLPISWFLVKCHPEKKFFVVQYKRKCLLLLNRK